jgi:Sensors of blue-light using FAD
VTTTTFHELHVCYLSRLAPGCDDATFADICRQARARNPERGIAGVLLFDGQRFLHWVYGRRDDVRQLMGSIALDARHGALSLRLEAMLPALELEPTWRSGAVDAAALDAFSALRSSDGAALLEGLGRLIDGARLEPPLPVPALLAARRALAPDGS